jgi:hypothetical protein
MAIRRQITQTDGVYFITFTCYKWLSLIDSTNGYDLVYKQFDQLKSMGHYIIGYAIMPNHLHALVAFSNTGKSINATIGNMKRFMAYEIVQRLQIKNREETLSILAIGVNNTDKQKGKLHEVFKPSFDCKECNSNRLIEQKLTYMHNNPCTGKWNLALNAIDYIHSSANFYATGKQGIYTLLNYMQLEDINLTTLVQKDQH